MINGLSRGGATTRSFDREAVALSLQLRLEIPSISLGLRPRCRTHDPIACGRVQPHSSLLPWGLSCSAVPAGAAKETCRCKQRGSYAVRTRLRDILRLQFYRALGCGRRWSLLHACVAHVQTLPHIYRCPLVNTVCDSVLRLSSVPGVRWPGLRL